MSLVARNYTKIARSCRQKLIYFDVPSSAILPGQRRWSSTTVPAGIDSKVSSIVDQIAKLTLLETADLVSVLKSRLNIPDIALQSFAAAPAAPAAAAAAATPAAEEQEVVQEKTIFNIKLLKFEASAKPKIIKEVKSLLGLSLVDSKKFVETAPKMLKEGLAKEDAEKIKKTFTDLGAEIALE